MRGVPFILASCCIATILAAPRPVDFNREVRPILSDKCFQCHGPDEKSRKAGLRLDLKDAALARIIASGNSAQSKLFQRVNHEKKALRMPPPYSGITLADKEVALLQRWIDEGAKWETHWSYTPPQRAQPPAARLPAWSRNPIDRFLLARLDREGLTPAAEADRITLLRRVTFDLTGLPPSLAEIDAVVKDKAPGAYERQVDRLLASPHFGERMAMQWLDLARYADTHGYHIDSHRDMWPWRDWVISAFNRNLSFDQFTVWQLAGDLLPNATREQRIATGFHRNHMINFEGGAIPEEYQAEYVADRVETTTNVWMATTLGCAKCHDHKYDPLAQKDFYRFGAFFNTIPEKGLDGQKGNAEPMLALPNDQQERQLAEWKQTTTALGQQLPFDDIAIAQWIWERTKFNSVTPTSPRDGLRAWYELDGNLTDISGNFRNGRVLKGDISWNPGGPVNRVAEIDASTQIRFPAGVLDSGKPFSVAFWFRIGRQKASTMFRQQEGQHVFEVGFDEPETLPLLHRGHHITLRWQESAGKELIVRTNERALQDRLYHCTLSFDGKSASMFLDGEPFPTLVEKNSIGALPSLSAPVEVGDGRLRLDDLRFYDRALSRSEAVRLAVHYPAEVLLITPGKRSNDQATRLREYYLTQEAPPVWRQAYTEWKALREKSDELESQVPSTMIMAEMETPRDTYLLGRGDYTSKLEKVTPGVPSALPPLPAGAKADRLALAQWLVSPQHPLTARVAVNRYWYMYFGQGIVKTTEDFGSQGEQPVHPELLDWLATEFVRSGWDVKAMQRLIVTSAAYRQSSRVTPALHERDPENRLHARGPRIRLPAEMIRDNALAAAGLLKLEIGGPSVLPYQPAGLWEELAFGEAFSAQEYRQDHGEKLYRRAMYTFWKRTSPPASLNTFDAPDREKCTSRRAVTNTPLQALVTLNDPTYVEAARNLAQVVLRSPTTDDARLRGAFLRVTARPPTSREMVVLRSALRGQIATYRLDPKAAAALLRVGESPVDPNIPAPVLAAWTNVCTVILNLDEAITRE